MTWPLKPDPSGSAKSTPATDEAATGFERVLVTEADGSVRQLNPKQFADLPLRDRIQYLMSGKLRFFRGGVEIPPAQAVRRG
jgi:hypothetical protein